MKRVLLLHREGVRSTPFAIASMLLSLKRRVVWTRFRSISIKRRSRAIDFPVLTRHDFVRDYLKGKYADRVIDVLVAVGDVALTFARDNREIFGNPAIVAVVSTAGQIEGRQDNVTGLQGGLAFAGTIELALALRPDTQHVFVVFGARDDIWQSEPEFERLKERIRPVNLVYSPTFAVDRARVSRRGRSRAIE